VKDALLLIDVINRFDHEDGERLLRSFRERLPGFLEAIERARDAGVPVVYVNDHAGRWDSDARELVRAAREDGLGGDVVDALAPREGDPFVIKARYSAFDHTLLEILLRELEVERLLMCGGATEMCVVQSAIDAREVGYKVTIVSDACAAVDEEMERLSLEYAERIVGAWLVRAGELVPGQA
jgi:nicotinamidase-related amidase